jgi:hypothetical protein
MKKALLLLSLAWAGILSAQSTSFTIERQLTWASLPAQQTLTNGTVLEFWTFDGCIFETQAPGLPALTERFPLQGRSTVSVEIVAVQYEAFAKKPGPDDAKIGPDMLVTASVEEERRRYFGRATSFTLRVQVSPAPPAPAGASDRGGPFTYTSALSNGTIYKFGVAGNGIYKLDFNYLKNELGIANLESIDPRTLRLYGNGGHMLSEQNNDPRPDDLIENAIVVVGEDDGKFDAGDYVLFYAVGPEPWTYKPSATDPQLTIRKHLYDRFAWYFIKTGDGNGLRVQEQPSLPASYVTTEFDDVRRLEDEKVNLLDFFVSAQGSGKRWFGDYFYQTREREYAFDFPNLVAGSPARLRAEFAGRSDVSTTVQLVAGGATVSRSIAAVTTSATEDDYAEGAIFSTTFTPSADNVQVRIVYPEASKPSEGWLDYIEVNARRRLFMAGSVLEFRDLQTLTQDAALFRLTSVLPGITVWDITDPQAPRRQQFSQNGDVIEFGAATLGTLRNFIAFADNAAFPAPEVKTGAIATQNLHGIDNVHMAIVYHPELEASAVQLADHRKNFSGLDVALVRVDQLYNEFSSGAKDPAAIRDFARMLLERQPEKFEYLLLFGDGSFDPKNNTNSDGNVDFVPVFETYQSFNPIYAYPSDDFFGLLGENEGVLNGSLDISVGRLTVRSAQEGQTVVQKIIDYDSSPATLGNWRLRQTYVADDEDQNAHINQADKLAIQAVNTEKFFNIEKIYLDAYQQVATSGGERFPDAEAAINSDVFKGSLILQYIGHGGPRGWAQERILDNNDIAQWENPNRYPLIITATCSFGGYDDPGTLTGGEQSLVKPTTGAIALFTTVRAVYITDNNLLTNAVQNFLFKRLDNGRYRTIGEILKDAKNTLGANDNARRFTLLGDPAMYLAMPDYRVSTTRINGQDVQAGVPDTLSALMPVELEGIVTDTAGALLPGFNGKVFVTIFDKAQSLQTLGQDPGSPVRSFSVQRNIIFKGSATVTGGQFKINFVVPKDINYDYGKGKISYYAENGTPLDAAGGDDNIVVGGNANLVQDDQPPLVQVFLNTDAFAFGGVTDDNPKILIKCADDYGMNVTGTSLGHDLTAVLDDNVQEIIVLNDFYESEQDNFRKGQALYPLRNLEPGRHKLRVKGWDIANNSGEGYTEFVVAEDGKVALDHVLNYPNPFTTNTSFQFEHNLAGQMLDIQISIFSVAGKLVKTILHSGPTEGFRVNDITWDGRDEYGDRLARGVYLYRVKVRGTDTAGTQATAESDFEKLVILK